MEPTRRHAVAGGVAYLVSFVSIPTLGLYAPARLARVAGNALPLGQLRLGVLLEVMVAVACVASAVALYPGIRRHAESLALGFVAARTAEAALILAGTSNILAIAATPTEPATVAALMAHYDAIFVLSQSLIPAANALLLGLVLLRSGLVARWIPTLGVLAAPLHLAAVVSTVLGVVERSSPLVGIAALPIAAWEFALGCYLAFRGFRTSHPNASRAAPAAS